MTRLQRWALLGTAVVLAAFLTGLVRGWTDTVPPEFVPTPSPSATVD